MTGMIDELEPYMESIAQRMFSNKASEVRYTLKFPTGEEYRFHIKKLKR